MEINPHWHEGSSNRKVPSAVSGVVHHLVHHLTEDKRRGCTAPRPIDTNGLEQRSDHKFIDIRLVQLCAVSHYFSTRREDIQRSGPSHISRHIVDHDAQSLGRPCTFATYQRANLLRPTDARCSRRRGQPQCIRRQSVATISRPFSRCCADKAMPLLPLISIQLVHDTPLQY